MNPQTPTFEKHREADVVLQQNSTISPAKKTPSDEGIVVFSSHLDSRGSFGCRFFFPCAEKGDAIS